MCFGDDAVIETANDIPASYFSKQREFYAIVIKVTDGDTYRVRHSLSRSSSSLPFTGKLSEHTIAVRIAAVDTPEVAKFGKPEQPFSQEAKEFATRKLLGKRVVVKVLSRDHYGRLIGIVKYKDDSYFPSFLCRNKNMSEQLLRKGFAAVYRQQGAQYDGTIDRWNKVEAEAIRGRKGMWINGIDNVVLPSDFKKKL